MAVAAVRTKPSRKPVQLQLYKPLLKHPLPAGRPRDWYISHNRRLKAMRLSIALLDSGVYYPSHADDDTIRDTAERIGVHPPSATTCRMVRALIRYGR
ncbi:hypothetical protein ABT160_15325 [Streptomyces sp. NPDC001941]|uniref:hypothetical protein n=1 Tax=Streptomyces sp. NPDC001941 TaxID=3154659 RepID=UPI00331C45B4